MQVEPRAPAHSQGFSKGFASAALGTTPVKRSSQAAGALPVLGEPLVESPDVQQRDFLPRQLCSQHRHLCSRCSECSCAGTAHPQLGHSSIHSQDRLILLDGVGIMSLPELCRQNAVRSQKSAVTRA